jgi:hypothetical protein
MQSHHISSLLGSPAYKLFSSTNPPLIIDAAHPGDMYYDSAGMVGFSSCHFQMTVWHCSKEIMVLVQYQLGGVDWFEQGVLASQTQNEIFETQWDPVYVGKLRNILKCSVGSRAEIWERLYIHNSC